MKRNRWSQVAKRRDFQPYAEKYHTNTTQLTELAGKAKLAYWSSTMPPLFCTPGCVRKRHLRNSS